MEAGLDVEDHFSKVQQRLERVGLSQPQLRITFQNLSVIDYRWGWQDLQGPLLQKAGRLALKVCFPVLYKARRDQHRRALLRECYGQLRPGNLTLLMGPPDSGKTLLLQTLEGKLHRTASNLTVGGSLKYADTMMEELDPSRYAVYVGDQNELIGNLTVRETLQIALDCQGLTYNKVLLEESRQKERSLDVEVDDGVDREMADLIDGAMSNYKIVDYIITGLGLKTCADHLVGDELNRTLSGGEMKRVALGEALISPKPVLLLDDALNGLDSAIAKQVVDFIRRIAHVQKKTIVISAQQLPDCVLGMFDDMILLAKGEVLFCGPLHAFRDLHPMDTDGVMLSVVLQDFVHQQHSVLGPNPRSGQSQMAKRMVDTPALKVHLDLLSKKDPLPVLAKKQVWKQYSVCNRLKRIQARRSVPLLVLWWSKAILIGGILAVTFKMMDIHSGDPTMTDFYLRLLFYSMAIVLVDGALEVNLVIMELPITLRHSEQHYYPTWAYLLCGVLLKLPASAVFSIIWSLLVYFPSRMPRNASNYFWFLLLSFVLHAMSVSLYRLTACFGRTLTRALIISSFYILLICVFKGDNTDTRANHNWQWVYWIVNPLFYIKKAFAINMFSAKQWQTYPGGMALDGPSLGDKVLQSLDCSTEGTAYWISLGAILQVVFWLVFSAAAWFAFALFPASAVAKPTVLRTGPSRIPDAHHGAAQTAAQHQQMARAQSKEVERAKSIGLPTSSGPSFQNANEQLNLQIDKEIRDYDEEQIRLAGELESFNPTAVASTQEPRKRLDEGPPRQSRGAKWGNEWLPIQPVCLSFSHINCRMKAVMEVPHTAVVDKQILRDCSGLIKPGALTGLLGQSGAGKTTLLNILASRKNYGQISGDVYLNDQKQSSKRASRLLSYLPQSIELLSFLTVGESVQRSVSLRLEKGHSKAAVRSWVAKVEVMLQLHEIRNTVIGELGKGGLKLAHRRRIAIAMELIANPSVLLLDEPTTGMYEPDALKVVRVLKEFAHQGRSIICSIHQPSQRILQEFNEVIVMGHGGSIFFQGDMGRNASNLVRHFQAATSYPPPLSAGENPADYILSLCLPEAARQINADFTHHYANSMQATQVQESLTLSRLATWHTNALGSQSRYAVSQFYSLALLLRQDFIMYLRDAQYTVWRLVTGAGLGLIIGLAHQTSGHVTGNLSEYNNVLRDLFIVLFFVSAINNMMVQTPVQKKRLVAWNERSSNMYSSVPFVLSTCLIELPFNLLQAVVYSVSSYWLIGFDNNAAKFAWHLLIVFLSTYAITLWGVFVTFVTPNMAFASVVTNIVAGVWTLYTGFVIPVQAIPSLFAWIPYTAPIYWCLGGLMVNQYGDDYTRVELDLGTEVISLAGLTERTFNLQSSFIPWIALILTGFATIYAALACAAFKLCRYHKI